MVLGIVVVETCSVHIAKIALNQGVVVGLDITCWLSKNGIPVYCLTHHRTTMVGKIAGEWCLTLFQEEMGNTVWCCRQGLRRRKRYDCQEQHRHEEERGDSFRHTEFSFCRSWKKISMRIDDQ